MRWDDLGLPDGSMIKESACNGENQGSVPELATSSEEMGIGIHSSTLA